MRYQKLLSAAATLTIATALTAALGTAPANAATCYWLYADGVDGDRGRLYYCYTQTSPGKYTAWAESVLITDTTPDDAKAIIRAEGDGFRPRLVARDDYGNGGSGGSFYQAYTSNVRFYVCGELENPAGPIVVNCFRMTRNG